MDKLQFLVLILNINQLINQPGQAYPRSVRVQ